jgi:hypothetical protein
MYITSIMTTQANKCIGWPPPIPLNYERQRIGLVVNTRAGGSMAKPYQLVLKYLGYKKYAYPYSHVNLFHASNYSSEW